MPSAFPRPPGLTPAQIQQFVRDGYVKIEHAFDASLAAAARERLWADVGGDPGDPATWTRPVVRLGWYADGPFAQAANTPILHRAFDQLVGESAWLPRDSLGTFPVRFPSREDPGDAGWHIDPGFGMVETPEDFLAWRTNIQSQGRALLMLFLFSDVGRHDAPTRLRVGSHRTMARRLHPAGEAGLALRDLVAGGFAPEGPVREVQATGMAGTVYLCHPFLVHAAQPHRGTRPRFMAQPPLLPAAPLHEAAPDSPVLQAIRAALAEPPPVRRPRTVYFR